MSQRLIALLQQRPAITVGFAKHQVVIDGVASDPRHPLLRTFAEKFHKQQIGAVAFQRDVTPAEIASMMTLVATEAERGARPLGLGDPEQLRQWPHVRLFAVTYDQLQMAGAETDEDSDLDNRSAQLWIGLARAAAQATGAGDAGDDPEAVARALNRSSDTQARDQVIVGYLLQIAQELKRDGSAASKPVREQMAQLISALDPQALRRIMTMGGDVHQRSQFLMDVSEALPADAVIEIARAAGETTGQTISTSLIRMLTKLSAFAEEGTPEMQAHADVALREQVQQLVRDWSLADPNPEEYTAALQQMSQPSQSASQTSSYAPEPIRIVQMAIEVGAVGVPFWRAVDELLSGGELHLLLQTLQGAAENPLVTALWARIANEENLRSLMSAPVVDFDLVKLMLPRMETSVSVRLLLDVLANSEVRQTRMGIIRLLVERGGDITSVLVEQLNDPRWYVKRNALMVLNELQQVPSQLSLAELARHDDPRVRREAISLWLRMPQERERAIFTALTDSDDGVLRTGLNAAVEHGVSEALAPALAARLHGTVSADIRLQLVRILGTIGNALALDTLLKTVVAGRTLFRTPKLHEPTPVVVTALAMLADRWPTHPHVKPVLKKARKSRHSNVRAAVERPSEPA